MQNIFQNQFFSKIRKEITHWSHTAHISEQEHRDSSSSTTFQKYLDWKAKTWRDLRLEVTQFKACPRPDDVSHGRLCFDLCDHAIFLGKWDDSLENYTLSKQPLFRTAAAVFHTAEKKIYTPFSTTSINTSERPIQPKVVSADTEYSGTFNRIFGRIFGRIMP